ncbi:MFS transporter [Bacillus thermotolerans]|uniref:L-Proline/Glycine betaine transporter ProP n=1 Tax=Bacillus thermotolerans TaxID=1221996 RepID=A0A0F5I3I3_BACTR|nr:MFS transporter [Bacillus thermotolerans]KKB37053.1 L-Proline/Glycine betaine transporter ProP [Bacillus thermotolerans]KKB40013.1 L-Proline/Glycine betaine transporter ProP [Bacillus thermotolerans]KKB43757.1 L-Proline/Glycine betaine transporter ProP [Bacillus thermotolerans]
MSNKPPLWTKDFISVSASNFFVFTVFYILLVTMPMYALEELGGNATEAGLLTTFFLLSAILIRPIAGQWIEKLGKKKVLISSQIIFLVSSVLYFFPDTLGVMLLLRLFHGIGFGMATTATGAMVADIIPDSRRGEGMGYYVMSTNLAMVIGPFLGLTFMQNFGSSFMFVMCVAIAALGLISGVIIRLAEKKHTARALSIFRVNLHLNELFEFSAIRIAVVGGFFSIVYASLLSFVSVYAEELQIGEAAGYFFVVYAVVLLLSRPFTGRWFDQYGANFIIYPSIILFAAGMLVLSQANTALVFLVAAGMIGVGWGTLFPSFQTIAIQEAPREKKASATATFLSIYDLGIGLGSFIIGWVVTQTSFSVLYLSCAIYVAAGLFIYLGLYGRKAKESKEKQRQMI